MSINGVQLIYRLQTTIRLLFDYRDNVDTYNIYSSTSSTGPFTLIGNVRNEKSKESSVRGKVVYEFNVGPTPGLDWDNTITHYLQIVPVIANVEQVPEGPMVIPQRYEYAKSINKNVIMFGYNEEEKRFIPVAVDPVGKVRTV
jgi:hypothetical protein